ncbi:MAG: hypothetical protein IAE80_15780 [Anaerolinea sp.]|nr:hypothetical protein [Anaerolinea sp.]
MSKYAAKPYVAGSPDALVVGQIVQAFVDNLESSVIAPLLPKHGFASIDPDRWYPHQNWMDVLHDLSKLPDHSSAFVAFGKQAVANAVMPPEIDTIPKALNSLHAIHHLNLRNIPEDEGYVVKRISEQHYHVYQNTPNPDDAIYGFIWGMVARFRKPGEPFTVEIIPNPNPEEIPGTLYDVQWGV